jgi:hypothetical protein
MKGFVRSSVFEELSPFLEALKDYGELCDATIYESGEVPAHRDLDPEELTLELEFILRYEISGVYKHAVKLPSKIFVDCYLESNETEVTVYLHSHYRFKPYTILSKKST